MAKKQKGINPDLEPDGTCISNCWCKETILKKKKKKKTFTVFKLELDFY